MNRETSRGAPGVTVMRDISAEHSSGGDNGQMDGCLRNDGSHVDTARECQGRCPNSVLWKNEIIL